MLLAQALGEYGALTGGGGVVAGLADALSTIEDTARHTEPSTWAFVGGGLFLLWFVFLRR
jgi:hypothetical protein